MPKSRSISQLQFALKPSNKLQLFDRAVHSLAVFAAFFNNLPWPARFAIAGLVALEFWRNRQRFNKEARIFKYSERLGWQLASGGEFEPVEILPSTVVTTRVIFMHIKHKSAQFIVHDALDEDDFRQLIVKLKLTVNKQPEADNFP